MFYGSYQERKKARTHNFFQNIFGWKLEKCVACNGSGRYDHNGSPPCGECDGTGKSRFKDTSVKLPEIV